MNNSRRKKVESAIDDLMSVVYEEQEAFDNLPVSIQCSDRGEVIEENVRCIEDAIEMLREIDGIVG